jgi:hypothetical protein
MGSYPDSEIPDFFQPGKQRKPKPAKPSGSRKADGEIQSNYHNSIKKL